MEKPTKNPKKPLTQEENDQINRSKKKAKIEYFDSNFLHCVGSKIGKVIKVDKTTATAERGQFTRICVEIYLSKPLLSKFWLKGKIWKIQYEGLRLICYNCGKINHKDENCPDLHKQEDHHSNVINGKTEVNLNPEHLEDFGSWMLVKKPTRDRAQPKPKKPTEILNKNSNNEIAINEANNEGSRFQILRDESQGQGKDQGLDHGENPCDIEADNIQGDKEQNMETVNEATMQSQQSVEFKTVQLGETSQPSNAGNKENIIPNAEKSITQAIPPSNSASSQVNQDAALKNPITKILPPDWSLCVGRTMETPCMGIMHPLVHRIEIQILTWVEPYPEPADLLLTMTMPIEPDLVTINQIDQSTQHITMQISRIGEDSWYFSAIYASPDPIKRQDLWKFLKDFAQTHNKPWMLKETRRSARLDRTLCNGMWTTRFSQASVKHLPAVQSDHCPLFISPIGFPPLSALNKPFWFQVVWLTHEKFQSFIEEKWESQAPLVPLLNSLSQDLQQWNKNVFHNIFQKKRELMARIGGIQKQLATHTHRGLIKLENRLRRELDEVLYQEELLWYQKFRAEWIRDGDRNTSFFHLSTLVRRWRNRIDAIRDDQDVWVTDKEEIKTHIVSYFASLYSYDGEPCRNDLPTNLFPMFPQHDWKHLTRAFTKDEVYSALTNMGFLKALGPVGFQALFFQKHWIWLLPM
ncbi:LINE-1 retrotransposable element ORF2 protein [Bienertia sinuspersici]